MASENPRLARGPFDPPADALAALERDRAYRWDLPDGPSSDLYSIEQVAAAGQGSLAPSFPTVAPQEWKIAAKNAQRTPAEYTAALRGVNRSMPSVLAMLGAHPGFVIGGSAAIYPLGPSRVVPRDIDLFMIDAQTAAQPAAHSDAQPDVQPAAQPAAQPDVQPAAQPAAQSNAPLWKRLGAAVDFLTECLHRTGANLVRSVLTPGLLTLHVDYLRPDGGPSQRVKVQFVLRAYRGISALLHAVDGIAPVAFDGRTAYTTSLGAFGLMHRLIVVDPGLRSVSYETRLHRYFERGFALQFPHMSEQSFKAAVAAGGISLGVAGEPGITFRFAPGACSILAYALELTGPGFESDYDPELSALAYSNRGTTIKSLHQGLLTFASECDNGPTRCLRALGDEKLATADLVRVLALEMPPVASAMAGAACERAGVDIAEWAAGAPEPRVKDLALRERLVEVLVREAGLITGDLGDLRLMLARELFKCDRDALTEIALDAVEYLTSGDAARMRTARGRIKTRLIMSGERLLDRHQSVAEHPIDWWITSSPGRQWTASYDPRAVAPAAWYGQHYAPAPAAAALTERLAALEDALRR